MNRLTPLIDRRPHAAAAFAAPAARPAPQREEEPGWLKDARLFGASYLAGVVVFSTFLA